METVSIILAIYSLSFSVVSIWMYVHYDSLYMPEREMLRRSMLVPILNTLLAIFMIIQLMVKEDERGSDE